MPNLLDEKRVKYVINEEKRVVAAYIPNTSNDFYDYLNSIATCEELEHCQVISGIYSSSNKVPAFPSRLYAVAHCDPRDTFDEEFGRKLAFARLVDKYTAACYTKMNALLKNSERLHNSLAEKFSVRINKENARAQSLDNWLEKNWPKETEETGTIETEPATDAAAPIVDVVLETNNSEVEQL